MNCLVLDEDRQLEVDAFG